MTPRRRQGAGGLAIAGLRRAALILGLLLAAIAAPALAMTVTAPSTGVLPKAAPLTVQWSTSAPAASVSVWLLEVTPTPGIVNTGWPAVANTGHATFTLPASVVCDAAHSYKIGVMVWGQTSTGLSSGPSIVESAETKPFRLSCDGGRPGTLTVIKTVVSDGPIPPPVTAFVVDVRCPPSGPNTSVTLNSGNRFQQVITGVAAGADCTVTEQPPAVPGSLARRGCHWETRYPDADSGRRTTLPAGANTTRRVVNHWICKPPVATEAGFDARRRDDVAIRKTGPTTVNVGDTVSYSLVVTNTGSGPINTAGNGQAIIIHDAIPAGFDLVSPQGTLTAIGNISVGGGWMCGSPTLTCITSTASPVLPGAAFPPLTIVVKAIRPGSYQQCAGVEWHGGRDSVAGNNRSCVGVTIRPGRR
ncbi:MAG: DUF5979 domain-containing protein [Caulobacter sp.]|nr:DUF5979 domain-containing protein [Caulobacter sp.]